MLVGLESESLSGGGRICLEDNQSTVGHGRSHGLRVVGTGVCPNDHRLGGPSVIDADEVSRQGVLQSESRELELLQEVG